MGWVRPHRRCPSAHEQRRTWALAALWFASIVVATGSWPMAVHGQENSCEGERPRALLLPPISSELLARIRGQTHDLCWQLVLVQTSEADEEGVGMEQRASRAARDHDALVVMWTKEDAADVRLVSYDEQHRETTERTFSKTAEDRSAQMEAIALAVRSTLQLAMELVAKPADIEARSNLAGSPKTPRGSAEGPRANAPFAHTPSTSPRSPPSSPPQAPLSSQLREVSVDEALSETSGRGDDPPAAVNTNASPDADPTLAFAVGVLGLADGATSSGLWGGWLEPRLVLPNVWFAVRLEHTLEGAVHDSSVKLGLTRRGAWLRAGLPIALAGVTLSPVVGVGYVQHIRRTRAVDVSLTATPVARMGAVAAEGGLSLEIPLTTLPGMQLAATVGVFGQWLSAAPGFSYTSHGSTVIHRVARVVPVGFLGLVLR